MGYEKTREFAREHGISADVAQSLVEIYADDMEADEPTATNSVIAARNVALDLYEIISQTGKSTSAGERAAS